MYQNGKKYNMKAKGDIFSGLSIDDNSSANDTTANKPNKTKPNEKNQQKIIKIIPIGEDLKSILKKNAYKNKFDILYMSLQAMTSLHNITNTQQSINDVLSKDAMIFVETTKYIFPLHSKSSDVDSALKEGKDNSESSFVTMFMKNLAKENHWKEVITSEKEMNTDTVMYQLSKDNE